MLKATTIRVPEDILAKINDFTRKFNLDRSSYLRTILKKGFEEDKRERLLLQYINKEASMLEVCKALQVNPWDFFDLLKKKNLVVSVTFEDFLQSRELT